MIDQIGAIIGIVLGTLALLVGVRWQGKRAARREVKKEMELLTAKEADQQERERIARDEKINGAADLAALARHSGLVRPTDAP